MKNLLQGKPYLELLKEALSIIAIVVGGLWVLFTFFILSEAETTQLTLEKLKKETTFQPVMTVKVSARTWQSQAGDYLIEATAAITNVGTLKEELDLSRRPFRFYPVVFGQSLPNPVQPMLKSNVDFPLKVKEAIVLPNETLHYRLLYKVPTAGLYYVEFVVPLSAKSLKQWQEKGRLKADDHFDWFDGVYIEVKPGDAL